jgi:hypothetical protein
MAGDVRRSGGQRHAADGAPSGGFAPPGPPHLPQTARTGAHQRCVVTSGRTDASACAPEAGTVRTAVVGDSPRGPFKQQGDPHLNPATTPKHAKPNHAGD